MLHLADLFLAAQKGQGFETLARMSGLNPDQAGAALSVLMPAFALGLERQAQSWDAMRHFAGLMGQAGAFTGLGNPGTTADMDPMSFGQSVLTQLFGGPEMAQRIAAQAAALSGVAQPAMQAFLPLAAASLMGAMARAMIPPGFGAAGNPFAAFASPNPMEGLTAAGEAMTRFMDQGMRMVFPGLPTPAAPEPPAAPDLAALGLAAMTRFFDTGRALQDQQAAAMRDLFAAMMRDNASSTPDTKPAA